MVTRFDTQEEAEAEVTKLNNGPIDIFCPLIPGECRKNCPCYQAAYMAGHGTNSDVKYFDIGIPLCNNAAFFNTCQYGC